MLVSNVLLQNALLALETLAQCVEKDFTLIQQPANLAQLNARLVTTQTHAKLVLMDTLKNLNLLLMESLMLYLVISVLLVTLIVKLAS